jgi:hypothetical protein
MASHVVPSPAGGGRVRELERVVISDYVVASATTNDSVLSIGAVLVHCRQNKLSYLKYNCTKVWSTCVKSENILKHDKAMIADLL